jgi:hypothetical protein
MILALWIHFFGDFVCQSDQMALNKSHSNFWLTVHVLVYSLCLLFFGWKVALLNGAAHWVIDYVTSRVNAKLWSAGQRHWFFVCVGFDQALHLSLLLWSLKWLR